MLTFAKYMNDLQIVTLVKLDGFIAMVDVREKAWN